MSVYADIFRYRELFANLFQRELRVKYKGSILGVAWSLANPLVLMGIYVLVFSTLWHVANGIDHYPLYLLSGLTVWIFFSASLETASRSMLDSAELIKKVRFPRQLVAFAVVATQLVTFALMLVILIVLSLVFIPAARSTVWLSIPLALGMADSIRCLISSALGMSGKTGYWSLHFVKHDHDHRQGR